MSQAVEQGVIDECVGNAHGNLARVQELIERYPEILNARATWNETPIEAATQMGNQPIIDFLIERGAPVDLFTACVLGDVSRVGAEIAGDPGLSRARGVHELPVLYFAAVGRQVEVAELLLRHGADVNARSEAAAPIHGAVMAGSPDLVRLLLRHGADASLPDFKGRGAKQLAIDMQRPDLEALLD
jgi:ankyrin repeat protein